MHTNEMIYISYLQSHNTFLKSILEIILTKITNQINNKVTNIHSDGYNFCLAISSYSWNT